MNNSTFTSFRAFSFSIFSSLIIFLVIFTFHKNFLLNKNKSPDLSYINWIRFFFKIIQHWETWNVIGLFPSYQLEEIKLSYFSKVVSYKYLYIKFVWIRYF